MVTLETFKHYNARTPLSTFMGSCSYYLELFKRFIYLQEPLYKPYYGSIVNTLKLLDSPKCYATGGMITMHLPSLSIVGKPDMIVGLPLCKSQATKIIEVASETQFGRGERRTTDASMKSTWQLNPTQFLINNPKWEKSISTLLTKVKTQLGCDTTMSVGCELHKLLLYEPGGFSKVSSLHIINV